MGKRYGRQEPTKSYFLDKETDTNYADKAIELYTQSGRETEPWQAKLLSHILAVDEDGLWRHGTFGFAVPRRNGKSEILLMVVIYFLLTGKKCLWTAHLTSTSTAAFERLVDLLVSMGLVEGGRGVHRREEDIGKDPDFRCTRGIGKERILTYDQYGKGNVSFRTRTTRGGLGEGYDLLIIDEAQEYTDDQNAALSYTINDSPNPLMILTGTPPTPISAGTVFVKLRGEILRGEKKYGGWAEWSVEKQTNAKDVEAWYMTNPALGYQLTERKIESYYSGDDVDFNIQRLGLWLEHNLHSDISEPDWDAVAITGKPQIKGKLFIGIKYGKGTSSVSMSVAVKTTDKKVFVEAIDCRSTRVGNGWIIDFLKSTDWEKVIVDGASGQQLLSNDMKDSKLKKPILPTVKEIIEANALFEQGLYKKQFCHTNQPSLHEVATNCEKRAIGSNGGFGYSSIRDDLDISLLDSIILAYWACASDKKKPATQVAV